MGRKILGEEYSLAELAFIQHLMSFVSQAIQNHLHYERTLRDVKTGLYNNGFFLTSRSPGGHCKTANCYHKNNAHNLLL
jgi:GAF domain-containing protein